MPGNSSPWSPTNTNGWHKPSKFTRPCSPEKNKKLGAVHVNSGDSCKGFHLLNVSSPSDLMDLGYELGPSPSNHYMDEASRLKLKQARSQTSSTLSLETTRGAAVVLCREGDDDLLEEQATATVRGAHH